MKSFLMVFSEIFRDIPSILECTAEAGFKMAPACNCSEMQYLPKKCHVVPKLLMETNGATTGEGGWAD